MLCLCVQVNFTVDQIRSLMDVQENIRNMSVIGQWRQAWTLSCAAALHLGANLQREGSLIPVLSCYVLFCACVQLTWITASRP